MRKSKLQSGKTVFNRVTRILSEIYGINEAIVMHYYNRYDKNVSVVKLHLSRINQAGHELEFINDVNLCY